MKDEKIKNVDLKKMFIKNGKIKDEYIKPDKEAEIYILNKVEEGKRLVRNFVKGTFGEKSEEKLEKLFERLPIIVKRNLNTYEKPTNFVKTLGGYIPSKKEINLSQEIYDYYKEASFIIAAIIHEIAHACSFEISKGKMGDDTLLTEEALADLFTEMCINYNLKNNLEMEVCKQFLDKKNEKKLYKMIETDYSDNGFGDYIRCVLHPLRLENKDVVAIKEYFFGSKEEFAKMLNESMDGEFEKVIKEINNKVKNEEISINESVEDIICEIVNILYEQDKIYNKKSFSKDMDLTDESLYPPETPYISLVYADYLVNEEIKKQNNFNKKSVEELKEFFNNTAEIIGNRYKEYGNTYYMDELVKKWYENTDGDLEKFNPVLTLADRLPKELILKIAEDQGFSENMDVLKYIELVNEYIGITQPENELIEYMLNHCSKKLNPEEKYEIFNIIREIDNIPIITDSTAKYLSNLDLDKKQEIDMYKFFYHEDEEDGINKLIDILRDKQILNSEINDENKDLINSMLIEIKRAKTDWKMFKGEQDINYELDENGKAKLTPNNMILLNIDQKKQIIELFNEMNIGEDIQNNFFEEVYSNDENLSNDLTKEDLLNILIDEGILVIEYWYEDKGVEIGDE